ncbi:hypothetical protein K227x_41810 [Rubripirellula lacrimiformis]|uniref:Sulfatase n=1 Tax=Rubripirellula lacrimiformis TaxID=1930273 RepID=A0A517NF71_9BACT|nr:DUF1501 domain-containing protein [Rubripirellula lacrimiformis]QDT05776.1 hypothetical protein K227x_41810 [Rubripirellula lacrimiformis]
MKKRETLDQQLYRQTIQDRTRRHFLRDCTTGLGGLWMATQNAPTASAAFTPGHDPQNPLSPVLPPLPAKVKRVIFLHMVGAPSQLEMFDYKPDLKALDGKDCPQSFLEGKRFAFINGTPKMLGPQFPFKQYGESGAWVSDRMPHLAQHVDDLCFIKTMQTDQFNHGPAQLIVHTGTSQMGSPSIGSWVTWGLGSENSDLPGFIVLLSGGRLPRVGKALWSAGFLPSVYQGVQCRSQGDPVLNVSNPEGVSRDDRRRVLDALDELNRHSHEKFGDPETLTRIAQYEMAYRMQTAAPEVMDLKKESAETLAAYGADPEKESFANNCLLARRLVENGVRFVQLFDWGWDTHGSNKSEALHHGLVSKCKSTDQPIAALLKDLKDRGLMEDTLVVWGGEFGRTPMRENRGGKEMAFMGRDHSPDAFTIWMAGAGVQAGMTYGETDAVGYTPATDPVQVRDLHATLMHLMGFDHQKISYPFKGLNQKLTGVKQARVVREILS